MPVEINSWPFLFSQAICYSVRGPVMLCQALIGTATISSVRKGPRFLATMRANWGGYGNGDRYSGVGEGTTGGVDQTHLRVAMSKDMVACPSSEATVTVLLSAYTICTTPAINGV